jgi:hypothetical protein|mmetsp:Transcript_28026/g.47496  ORF Transcript_28026/g.47496 Transcript_28026/m.47496 type:complete len:101 (-) Transcript_28026:325-627(-)
MPSALVFMAHVAQEASDSKSGGKAWLGTKAPLSNDPQCFGICLGVSVFRGAKSAVGPAGGHSKRSCSTLRTGTVIFQRIALEMCHKFPCVLMTALPEQEA